jgi:hypothetical protein
VVEEEMRFSFCGLILGLCYLLEERVRGMRRRRAATGMIGSLGGWLKAGVFLGTGEGFFL